jgi:hypothetical protein
VSDRVELYGVTLPTGWTVERWGRADDQTYVIKAAPEERLGSVTIAFKSRVFRRGISITGPGIATKPYKGRNWRMSLVADAVRDLGGSR